MKKLSMSELNRVDVGTYKVSEKIPVTIILDNIRSQNNIGSVFRTADAFRVKEILLCGITSTPPHREIQKTALGATESVKWQYFEHTEDAVQYFRKENVNGLVYAVEQVDESIKLDNFQIEGNSQLAFILGNEVKGVEDHVLLQTDGCIEIPQFGTKHSLNISVCAGIVIWDVYQKLNQF